LAKEIGDYIKRKNKAVIINLTIKMTVGDLKGGRQVFNIAS